ncbi:SIR2 family NAD-dependent protein deacylase [Bacteroides sedimenti]|uniref:NAD-dependent protein deacylase n=1 Tax=Bacteroides sedimenti TaxID=2136147 RepID=A0ABM8ID83_9BACE
MKKLVVLSGAGMSAESGVSTFRDAGGLWDRYPVEEVATPEGYRANPGLVINFYNERRRQLLTVEPNEGHHLVAELEKNFDVTVVTQNIDNLHERAGSSHIIHLHGELTKICSSYDPHDTQCIKELTPDEYEVKLGDLAPDGSQYRPYIVWFGEAVPKIEDAIDQVEKADIFLIIGTSMNVYPAAGLLNYVRPGAKVFLIDPKEVNVRSNGHQIHVIRKVASEGMRELLQLLSESASS